MQTFSIHSSAASHKSSLLRHREKLREIAATVQRDDAAFADQLISSIRQPYRDALQQYY